MKTKNLKNWEFHSLLSATKENARDAFKKHTLQPNLTDWLRKKQAHINTSGYPFKTISRKTQQEKFHHVYSSEYFTAASFSDLTL